MKKLYENYFTIMCKLKVLRGTFMGILAITFKIQMRTYSFFVDIT